MPINAPGAFLAPPPPKPVAKPLPVANPSTSNNPRGTSITARPAAPPPKMLLSSANPRGTAIVQPQHASDGQRSGATNPDPASVVKVFRSQPVPQQQAILRGALQNPNLPTSKILLSIAKQQVAGQRLPGATITSPRVAVGSIIAGSTPVKIVENAAKDAWNLPGGTVEGLYGLGSQTLQAFEAAGKGNFGGAASHLKQGASMLVDPYVRLGAASVADV